MKKTSPGATEAPTTSVNVGSLGSIMVNSGPNISNSSKPVTVQTLPLSTPLSALTALLTNQLKQAGYSVASGSTTQSSTGYQEMSSVSNPASATRSQGVAYSQPDTQIQSTPEPKTYDFKVRVINTLRKKEYHKDNQERKCGYSCTTEVRNACTIWFRNSII